MCLRFLTRSILPTITLFLRLGASEMHQKMKDLDVVSNLLKQPQKVSKPLVLGHYFINCYFGWVGKVRFSSCNQPLRAVQESEVPDPSQASPMFGHSTHTNTAHSIPSPIQPPTMHHLYQYHLPKYQSQLS